VLAEYFDLISRGTDFQFPNFLLLSWPGDTTIWTPLMVMMVKAKGKMSRVSVITVKMGSLSDAMKLHGKPL
jgi:hypothetical protein